MAQLLRHKLERAPAQPSFLLTEPGLGIDSSPVTKSL